MQLTLNTMNDLFPNLNECKSPRLVWFERNAVESHLDETGEAPVWLAWSSVDGHPSQGCLLGEGENEDAAIAAWALKKGLLLWNEEVVTKAVAPVSFLRPSLLPKLSLCGHFRSGEVGAAAERGTRIDVMFRDLVGGVGVMGESDEVAAAQWGQMTALAFAGQNSLDATEAGCAVSVPVKTMTGTADVVCRNGMWSADLKTGIKRDYVSQQACYALGFMDDLFLDEWTVYLLYCDLEAVETLRFTRESALECIFDALALYIAKEDPQLNDYCGWCSQRFTCPARRELIGQHSPLGAVEPDWKEAESDRLAMFIAWAGVAENWADEARKELKERLLVPGAAKVSGVYLTSRKGAQKFKAELLPDGVEATLKAELGMIPYALAEKCFSVVGQPLDEGGVVTAPGTTSVTVKLKYNNK